MIKMSGCMQNVKHHSWGSGGRDECVNLKLKNDGGKKAAFDTESGGKKRWRMKLKKQGAERRSEEEEEERGLKRGRRDGGRRD